MEYFLIVFIFFMFAAWHSYSFVNFSEKEFQENQSFVNIYFLLVFLIALGCGLRGDNEYSRFFNYTLTLGDFFSSQNIAEIIRGPVFALIMSSLKTIGLSSQSLLILFAFTSIFIHAIYYRKYTEYYFLAFLIYLGHEIIFKEFATIRAGLASALVLPIIYYIQSNQKLKYWSLILIGGLIQYVGFLSVFLIHLNRRFDPRLLIFILFASVLIYFIDAASIVLNGLASAGLLPSIVSSYLSYDLYVYDAGLGNFKLIQQVIVILSLMFAASKTNIEKHLPHYNLLFNAYFLSTIMLIVFAPLALFAFRFGGHFYSVEPILIAYFIYNFSSYRPISVLACVGALGLAFLNYVLLQKLESYIFLVDDYRIFLGY